MTDLADYDLIRGDTVRFRRKERANWTEAHVLGINKDGSVNIGTGHGVRALLPQRLEVKRTGPKGGRVWLPVPVPVTTNSAESSTPNEPSSKNSTTP